MIHDFSYFTTRNQMKSAFLVRFEAPTICAHRGEGQASGAGLLPRPAHVRQHELPDFDRHQLGRAPRIKWRAEWKRVEKSMKIDENQ